MNVDHVPVLLAETIAYLRAERARAVLDATVGLGGHARALLAAMPTYGTLIGIDADAKNIREAQRRLEKFSDRATLIQGNFCHIKNVLPADRQSFDAILADLGLSSPHIDDIERGFSFHGGAPLDMRFDQTEGRNARDVLLHASPKELKMIFQEYGELPRTDRFVRAIVDARKHRRIRTSDDVLDVARPVYGHELLSRVPQIFQALRICVNDELTSLVQFLTDATAMLRPGGRIGVISYHSLEDRIVKRAMKAFATPDIDPITGQETRRSDYLVITRQPVVPSEEEQAANPRSRSAKFRVLERC
jgi:16S rRNA (cytosine1402-N4)-methyltransferase